MNQSAHSSISVTDSQLTSPESQGLDPPEEKEDLSPLGYNVAAVVLSCILVIGCFNNLVVILVVTSTKKLRTPMNFILLNLSVNDFTISLLGTPFTMVSAIKRGWYFGPVMCKIYGFAMTLTGMTAIGTLVAIAIERYIIMSRSFHGQNLTPASAVVTISLVWTYSLVQALPPLFGWNRYVVEHPGIACSLDWQTPDFSHSSFIVYIFFLGYVLPIFIMTFCYVSIVCIIKKSPKPNMCSSTAKAERKVTVMTFVMLLCTLVAWTPYAVVSLMVSLGYEHLLGPVGSVCPAIFAKTSVVYNPIVYFFLNTQIRETIMAKIPRFFHRRESESIADISLETKRGLTIINTVISSHILADFIDLKTAKATKSSSESANATTQNL